VVSHILGFALSAFPAYVDIDWLYEAHFGESTVYAKKLIMRRYEQPRLLVLYDHVEVGEFGDKSAVYLYESNCEARTIRRLRFVYYTGSMGNGDDVRVGHTGVWEATKARTNAGNYVELMCTTNSTLPERLLTYFD
jgi:hypothetical protein